MNSPSELELLAAHEAGHCIVACLFNIDVSRVSVQSGYGISAAANCQMHNATRSEKLGVYLAGWAGKAYFYSQSKKSRTFDLATYRRCLPKTKDGAGSVFGVLISSGSDMANAIKNAPLKALFPRSSLVDLGKTLHEHRRAFYTLTEELQAEFSLNQEAIAKIFKEEPLSEEDRSLSRNSDIDHWYALTAKETKDRVFPR